MFNNLKLPRWHKVILALLKNNDRYRYCEKLNRKINGSKTHLREIVNILVQKNIVRIIPTKKIHYLALTQKGVRIALAIQNVESELNKFN